MSQINLNNYEAYLLDLSEGNLTEEVQMELELFLIQHPELGIDLSELSLVSVEHESVSFGNKKDLKKTEGDLISETQFISYIEGLSSPDEKLHLEKSCSLNQTLKAELELYKLTVAQPELSVVYPSKDALKRKPKVIWLNFSATQFAAAASILLILGLIFLWPKTELVKNESELAKTDTFNSHSKTIVKPVETTKSETANVLQANNQTKQVIKNDPNGSITNNKQVALQTNVVNTSSISVPQPEKNEPIANNVVEGIAQSKNETNTNPTKALTVVETITENDDEPVASNQQKPKKGIWAIAGKALKSLNTLGVKSVNGEEEDSKNNTSYALTLGGLNITHKSAEKL